MSKPTKHLIVYSILGIGALTATYQAFTNYTIGTTRQWYLQDMFDARMVKAFEAPMMLPAEGSVAHNDRGFDFSRHTGPTHEINNPVEATEESVAEGARLYDIYCHVCHNAAGAGMGPIMGKVPASGLAGWPIAGTISTYSDGKLYLTIRDGGDIKMPAYGWAMDDDEIWAMVNYLRTLPNSQYVPPAPPAEE